MKKSLCIIALDKMLSNIPIKYEGNVYIIDCINSNETVHLIGNVVLEYICITELELI